MVTGFVLAGGKSSRIGRDKAFLTLGGRTFIETVIQRLRPQVDRLIVVGSQENSVRLRNLLVDRVIVDLVPDRGPLMAIYTSLMTTDTPLNLFVPCDMLWVDKSLIHALLQRVVEGADKPAHAVAGLHPVDGIQPFPLLCHTDICPTIGALLARRDRSVTVKDLFAHPDTQLVLVEEPDLWRSFTSVSTWEDYARLCDNPLTPP